MELHKLHTPPPVWLIYVKPWRDFRKFHYDPIAHKAAGQTGVSPPTVFIPSVYTQTDGYTISVTLHILINISC